MDKTRKLKRYLKKDYTQVVDFPVEIVGRDGVVRRYTFEASVRLYQRRIVSAPSRYDDGEVVDAEVRHCRRRIEQLRHSYYKRFGWSRLELGGAQCRLAEIAGEYAGEVAAFLRRLYGDTEEAEALEVELVGEQDGHHLFFVRQRGTERRFLLYLYRFESHGACESREAFFELLRSVQGASGEAVERLLAFHHTADCGLVLTSTATVALPEPPAEEEGQPIEQYLLGRGGADPFDEGLQQLASGQSEGALARFERAVRENPLHRRAYVAAAVVSDALGQLENAELIAQMGLHHFEGDSVLLYHLGLARFRRGELAGAREALEQSLAHSPQVFPSRFLLAALLLAGGHYREAQRAFGDAADCARDEDAEALSFIEQIERQLTLRRIGLALAALLLIGGLALLPLSTPAARPRVSSPAGARC